MESPKLASLDEIKQFKPTPKTQIVVIGGMNFRIKELLSASDRTRMLRVAQARKGVPLQIDGENVLLEDGEEISYQVLSDCLDEPKLSFADVVKLSRLTGEDCLLAAVECLKLNNLWDEAIEQEKKGSKKGKSSSPTPADAG